MVSTHRIVFAAVNDRPLSEVQVKSVKTFLRRNASTSYFELSETDHDSGRVADLLAKSGL